MNKLEVRPSGGETKKTEIRTAKESVYNLIFFNWNIVDLQCCVNCCYTAKWCRYIHSFWNLFFHYGLWQNVEYNSLCCTVGPYCLSILYAFLVISVFVLWFACWVQGLWRGRGGAWGGCSAPLVLVWDDVLSVPSTVWDLKFHLLITKSMNVHYINLHIT